MRDLVPATLGDGDVCPPGEHLPRTWTIWLGVAGGAWTGLFTNPRGVTAESPLGAAQIQAVSCVERLADTSRDTPSGRQHDAGCYPRRDVSALEDGSAPRGV